MSRRTIGGALLGLAFLLPLSACTIGQLPDGDSCANDSQTAIATQGTAATVRLTAIVGPSAGSGIVTSTPAAIQCYPTCAADVSVGTTVSLTAAALPGWAFDHWQGDCAGTSPTVAVTMDMNKTCDAMFVPVYPGEGDAGASTDPGSNVDPGSSDVGMGLCCAAAGTELSYAACEVGGDKCCLPVTANECTTHGGIWMDTAACKAAGPEC